MKINLFSIPIWIGNIDASKIVIDSTGISETFQSDIKTSFKEKNSISKESLDYLYSVMSTLLNDTIPMPYLLKIDHIWNNYYETDDYQELHTHPGSDISFIIYKKIKESSTVFQNPNNSIVGSYYHKSHILNKIFGGIDFQPECRENQIVIFPSFLEHYVKKTSNALTIAGNASITIQ